MAQHTFALLFYVLHRLAYYDHYVKSGAYCENPGFSHFDEKFSELDGKTWGIVGLGAIGRRVAAIAEAFGCHVIYYSTSGRNTDQPYERVDFEEFLKRSDVISLHAPLNPDTEGIMNREAFRKMKKSAFLVNVARGGLVVEQDLADALNSGKVAFAGLDVVSTEPIRADNPLLTAKNCIITPHMSWGSQGSRQRIMDCTVNNIRAFLNGTLENVVNP